MFQHTAARRRLPIDMRKLKMLEEGFNTQPREGGCVVIRKTKGWNKVSTHSRAKAAASMRASMNRHVMFQHTAARRRLPAILDEI